MPVETLGGYRLIRRLGAGRRADIWLGHDHGVAVAIKVFRTGVDRPSIDTEIEALGRASSHHLMRLEDLATTREGVPCLILQRLAPAGLGRMLAERVVTAGESVTILAPLALAVAELHRVGVAHGGLGVRSVLFDGRGAPVLGCFGASSLPGPFPDQPQGTSLTTAKLAASAEVVGDLQQLAELTARVLQGVDGGARVGGWLQRSDPSDDPARWPLELADRLFHLAEPTAIAVTAALEGTALESTELERTAEQPPRRLDAVTVPALLALPPTVADSLTQSWEGRARQMWGRAAELVPGLRASLGRVRRRVWVLAATVAVLVAVAGMVLSLSAARDGPPAEQAHAAGGAPSQLHTAAIHGDDPVQAGKALLEARAVCFERLTVLCLDGVDQPASSAWDADSTAIRLAQQGAVETGAAMIWAADEDSAIVELVERFGDTALLSVVSGKDASGSDGQEMAPASLLLVKGEAGWLIRDLVAPSGDASEGGDFG